MTELEEARAEARKYRSLFIAAAAKHAAADPDVSPEHAGLVAEVMLMYRGDWFDLYGKDAGLNSTIARAILELRGGENG